jgi:hypothetical protein
MAESNLRLSGTGTTMWRAWVGFNFSHSLGVVLFGTVCIGAGLVLGTIVLPAWILFVFVVIALLYFVMGLLYWFHIPVAGIAVAESLFWSRGLCILLRASNNQIERSRIAS